MAGNAQRERIHMEGHAREGLFQFSFPVERLIVIAGVGDLHMNVAGIPCAGEARIQVMANGRYHSATGILFAARLCVCIQALALYLQNGLDIQHHAYCGSGGCNAAALFKVFERFQRYVYAGVELYAFQYLAYLTRIAAAPHEFQRIQHRLTLSD